MGIALTIQTARAAGAAQISPLTAPIKTRCATRLTIDSCLEGLDEEGNVGFGRRFAGLIDIRFSLWGLKKE